MGLLSLPFLKPKEQSKRVSKSKRASAAGPPYLPTPVFKYSSLLPSVVFESDSSEKGGLEQQQPKDSEQDVTQPGIPGLKKAPCDDLSRYPLIQSLPTSPVEGPPLPPKDHLNRPLGQAPLIYSPFQTGYDHFKKSEGSGEHSVFPDARHFPFIPTSPFHQLFDVQPDYPPANTLQPQQAYQQAPSPLQPDSTPPRSTKVMPVVSATKSFFRRSADMSHGGGAQKGKGRESDEPHRMNDRVDRSRFSMPPGSACKWRFCGYRKESSHALTQQPTRHMAISSTQGIQRHPARQTSVC